MVNPAPLRGAQSKLTPRPGMRPSPCIKNTITAVALAALTASALAQPAASKPKDVALSQADTSTTIRMLGVVFPELSGLAADAAYGEVLKIFSKINEGQFLAPVHLTRGFAPELLKLPEEPTSKNAVRYIGASCDKEGELPLITEAITLGTVPASPTGARHQKNSANSNTEKRLALYAYHEQNGIDMTALFTGDVTDTRWKRPVIEPVKKKNNMTRHALAQRCKAVPKSKSRFDVEENLARGPAQWHWKSPDNSNFELTREKISVQGKTVGYKMEGTGPEGEKAFRALVGHTANQTKAHPWSVFEGRVSFEAAGNRTTSKNVRLTFKNHDGTEYTFLFSSKDEKYQLFVF